jgi:hypothetical protein
MANRHGIPVRGAQGDRSRQAHAGAYEREISEEGFSGRLDSWKTPA